MKTKPFRTISVRENIYKELCDFLDNNTLFKSVDFIGYSIKWVIDYYQDNHQLPADTKLVSCTAAIPTKLMTLASDLPGMSLAVIQSHLIRFPKVTPDLYKRILEHLNQQHAEGKLKNPEAAAYGLCKLAQNGKLPEGIIATPAPAAQEPAPQAIVPKEALMPFAK